jgi:hypothetical protein
LSALIQKLPSGSTLNALFAIVNLPSLVIEKELSPKDKLPSASTLNEFSLILKEPSQPILNLLFTLKGRVSLLLLISMDYLFELNAIKLKL